MEESGLFEHVRIPQVQALVYIHPWKNRDAENSDTGGDFLVYENGPKEDAKGFPVKPGSMVACDGSKAIHGTKTFQL